MPVYALVSVKTGKVIESFVRREDAEAFVEEVREDDAELADLLRASSSATRPSGSSSGCPAIPVPTTGTK